jgi:chemotaxis protein histidine kinase CheA
MPQDDGKAGEETQALVHAVHAELRRDFLLRMPERVAEIEAIAQALHTSPADPGIVQRLQAETHRLTGTTGLYGLVAVSAVAKRFDLLLLERIRAGIIAISATQVDSFLAELRTAIAAER